MAFFSTLKSLIGTALADNSTEQISPNDVRSVNNLLLSDLEASGFRGVFAPTDAVPSGEGLMYGIASSPGTYTNFGVTVAANKLAFISNHSGAWAAYEVDAGTGSGDMLKSTYDTDNDGVVELAKNLKSGLLSDWSFYGKDDSSNKTFHNLSNVLGDHFMGRAVPSTMAVNPTVSNASNFYLATSVGEYLNFDTDSFTSSPNSKIQIDQAGIYFIYSVNVNGAVKWRSVGAAFPVSGAVSTSRQTLTTGGVSLYVESIGGGVTASNDANSGTVTISVPVGTELEYLAMSLGAGELDGSNDLYVLFDYAGARDYNTSVSTAKVPVVMLGANVSPSRNSPLLVSENGGAGVDVGISAVGGGSGSDLEIALKDMIISPQMVCYFKF